VGKKVYEKFMRLAEVLGIECPHKNMEKLHDQVYELALEMKDPKRKLERRRKREAKKKEKAKAETKAKEKAHRPGDVGGKKIETMKIEEQRQKKVKQTMIL